MLLLDCQLWLEEGTHKHVQEKTILHIVSDVVDFLIRFVPFEFVFQFVLFFFKDLINREKERHSSWDLTVKFAEGGVELVEIEMGIVIDVIVGQHVRQRTLFR